MNSWKLEYAKNPPKGFFKKSSSPEAIETFAYSDFSGYRKADGTRDLNFVKDYLKVRDTMMLYQSPQAFATTGITHEYDILVNQMELARGIFLSLFKQKYYGKGYRDIDEEIKYWFPGTFTDFGDNLTFDGRNVYEKYTPIYLMRYFGGERVDKFPGKGFEKALEDVSATVDGMRAGCTDENAFLKKVIVLREGYEAERKGYDMKYRKTFKDYESFYAMKKMELILGMLNGYISFHSISNLPALREFYAIASLDKDGNAVFSKKTEKVRKLK